MTGSFGELGFCSDLSMLNVGVQLHGPCSLNQPIYSTPGKPPKPGREREGPLESPPVTLCSAETLYWGQGGSWKEGIPQIFLGALRMKMELSCVCRPGAVAESRRPRIQALVGGRAGPRQLSLWDVWNDK